MICGHKDMVKDPGVQRKSYSFFPPNINLDVF